MNLTPKFRERLLESARLAGEWYVNCQNTEEHPWGGVHESADFGRYIYEYFVARQWCRGAGVWAQGLAIMALMSLERQAPSGGRYSHSAILAGEYLKSLQIINPSNPRAHGGFAEHNPQTTWSFPRDGATGGMGFCALYRETGKQEYLDRAAVFAQWYHDHGSYKDGWPYGVLDFVTGQVERGKERYNRGDWQMGGGLVYYWLYKLTGDAKWMDYFRQMIDIAMDLYEKAAQEPINFGFHGRGAVTYGNDDFAIIGMISAYRHWGEKRMLDTLTHHLKRVWQTQDADGSYPNFAGTFVTSIDTMEYADLCREKGIKEDLAAMDDRVMRTANFGFTLQETCPRDLRAYGGYYGQSQFGVSRERIHHRDAGYCTIMNLRIASGGKVPYYSSYGWEETPKPAFECPVNPNSLPV